MLRRTEEQGLGVDDIVAELITKVIAGGNPEANLELHTRLCEKNLQEGEQMLRDGNYEQASEKFWGATAEAVKAAAAKRGEIADTHAKIWDFIGEIVEETWDREYGDLFSQANALHKNFYESKLPPIIVKLYIESAKRLIEGLK
jgi:hypothetical protein